MDYRCEATSLEGFVQQLATSYLTHGYYFYVTGQVPETKDPRAVDAKLIARYAVGRSKWAAARRKRAGRANVQYLRVGHFFVLLATHGAHRFFEEECGRIQDVRHVALKVGGYAVSVRHGHVRVAIEREEYRRVKAYLLERATHRNVSALAAELGALPFEPYAPNSSPAALHLPSDEPGAGRSGTRARAEGKPALQAAHRAALRTRAR